MTSASDAGWRTFLPAGIRPYAEPAPLAALALGISSGFPLAMIGATMTTRLAQSGIDWKTVGIFSLALLMYNLKFLWAPIVDRAPIPWLSRRIGQRRAWLIAAGTLVALAVTYLAFVDPAVSLRQTIIAALFVAFSGATYDIVIDGYRTELLPPPQLAAGAGMSQYGYRIGSATAAGIALLVAVRSGWCAAYLSCVVLVLPAILAGLIMGEPRFAPQPTARGAPRGLTAARIAVVGPLVDFFSRPNSIIVFAFILIHKIGDTLANLTAVRLLLVHKRFSNDEIAFYDVSNGALSFLLGIFLGGLLYNKAGLKSAVLISLILMGVSNLSFVALAIADHSIPILAFTIGFENVASGIGGVAIVAYLSVLCAVNFTTTQFALLSAASSIVGRLISGTTVGALIESLGFVDFYVFTTLLALPGIIIFVYMLRAGLVDDAIPVRPLPSS